MSTTHSTKAGMAPTTKTGGQAAAADLLPAVPLLALDRQYAVLRNEIQTAITRVCDSGKFVLGPDVTELEAELARLLDVPHAISWHSWHSTSAPVTR
jgi:hypothetical protein